MIEMDVHLQRGHETMHMVVRDATSRIGIFGASGAGKSTLLHLIAGLIRPQAGFIRIGDTTVCDIESDVFVPPHKRRVGLVFQDHRLFPHRSVRGNLLYGAPRRTSDLGRTADMLELSELLDRSVHTLSIGQRQRVAIGRALLRQPDVLLLDEPLASLDHHLRRQILPALQRIHDTLRLPLLHVSHDLRDLLQLTDSLLLIDKGRTVMQGTYHDLVHEGTAWPLVHRQGLTNVVAATVASHHVDDGLSALRVGTGESNTTLVAPMCPHDIGQRVWLAISPTDIAVAQAPVDGVSIRNQIRGTVRRCTTHGPRAIVEVDVGVPLVVELSPRSVHSLALEPSRSVVCLIKSHAIDVMDAPRHRSPALT